ncbi:MAG: hypothetical protein ACO1RX_19745 [Candidatus Sericytochromatia bacterium]
MSMQISRILALTLSLTLAGCQQAAVLNPPPVVAPLGSSEVLPLSGGQEQLVLKLSFGGGFRTQLASASELAYVRVRVEGSTLAEPVYANNGEYVAVVDGGASVSIAHLPQRNGEVRRVYAEGYSATYQALGAFRASGWYRSQSEVTTVNVTLNRAQNLLVDVLGALSETVLSSLDIAGLQTLLLELQGYDAATGTFAQQPEHYSASGIAGLLTAGGALPELSALQSQEASTQAVTVPVATPYGFGLAENVRYVLNDTVSRPQLALRGSSDGSTVSLGEVSEGSWTLRAYGEDNRLLGATQVTVSGNGVTQSPLLLTGVYERFPESLVNSYTNIFLIGSSVSSDADGDFVVVWESVDQDEDHSDIYAQRYSSMGIAQGSEFRVNSYTRGEQQLPSVSSDGDGDFVVVWQSRGQNGSDSDIYGQRYSSMGVAQGSEFRVNSYTPGEQRNPSVSSDGDGDFVVVWQSRGQNGSDSDIYGQRYSSMGVVQGNEFRVNSSTNGSQENASVSSDAEGNFVVAWESMPPRGGSLDVYAQRYSSSGVAQGSEFRVNSYTSSSQEYPSVSSDGDGDFVVVWQSSGQDGSDSGVYGQRYSSMGVAQGSEFRVNSYTRGEQQLPSVSSDADGDFVVVWQSSGQDGSDSGVYGQRYSSMGLAQGSEFRVNSYTHQNQIGASVSLDADGDFVVVWDSDHQDVFEGVYAQRYNSQGFARSLGLQP